MSSSISTKMNTNDGSRLSRSFLLFLFSINEAPCHPGFVSSPPLSLFVLACIDLLLGLGQNSSFLSLSFRFPFFFEVKHAVGCSWADVCCCCYCCWCFSTCTSTYISFEFFFPVCMRRLSWILKRRRRVACLALCHWITAIATTKRNLSPSSFFLLEFWGRTSRHATEKRNRCFSLP